MSIKEDIGQDVHDRIQQLRPDPEKSAELAGLVYVDESVPGYRRKRWGRGFTYLDPSDEHVDDPDLREWIERLTIPPAWTDVWISTEPEGHILATGRDEEGRKQYIYHPRWCEIRNQLKFARMLAFGEALPLIRARVDEDLRRRTMSREKVLAIVVGLLEETLIRVGNSEYARNNGSYGLTTLENRHVDISGTTMHFRFQGKSGKEVELDVRNRRLARMVKRCEELPGQTLFEYVDEDGAYQSLMSDDVNQYLHDITGADFTAKDFRTWSGTVLAATTLYDAGPRESEKDCQHEIVQAIKQVAEALGNTPAVCRAYYVAPAITEAYTDGSLFDIMENSVDETANDPYGLSAEEAAVVAVLRRHVSTNGNSGRSV